MCVVHYPWRVAFSPEAKLQDLPVPSQDRISPTIGTFAIGEDGLIEELPGPTVRAGVGQQRVHGDFGDFVYADSVPQFHSSAPESACRRVHFALTDAFVRLSDFLYRYRYETGRLKADRSISEACEDFLKYLGEGQDFAPESLIVRIARDTSAALKDIVENPRVVLRREHEQVPLDRLQELDIHSLQDFARRPGRTAAMKAGRRQRLTGVVREETPNTFENRVVRSFVELAVRSARQYKEEMCARWPRRVECESKNPVRETDCSERVRTVYSFDLFCQQLLRSATFSTVTRMSEPATVPNYVLQQNPRYLNIWKYYQRLLRQEDVEADVWRWRRRCWADLLRFQMMLFWDSRLRRHERFVLQTSAKPFMIRETNRRGTWLCSDPFEDAAVFKADDCYITLYLLNAAELTQLTRIPEMTRLNADFYWVSLASEKQFRTRILPVWCMCPDKTWEGRRDLDGKVCSETKALMEDWSAKYPDYDFSQSVVLLPDDTPFVTDCGGHRFCRAELFSTEHLEKFFSKLDKWIGGLIR